MFSTFSTSTLSGAVDRRWHTSHSEASVGNLFSYPNPRHGTRRASTAQEDSTRLVRLPATRSGMSLDDAEISNAIN